MGFRLRLAAQMVRRHHDALAREIGEEGGDPGPVAGVVEFGDAFPGGILTRVHFRSWR